MAIKKVVVKLVAEGGKLVQGEIKGIGDSATKTAEQVEQASERMNRRLASFARAAGAAAAALATAAVATGVLMVRSGLQVVDAQAKLAQSLGTTVESIQVLERAGAMAGVGMAGIEQATKALTQRLSQAASGTGPAVDALKRLGLTAGDLIAMPLDQRVQAINAAIAAFVPVAERAAVSAQLFGEEGGVAMGRIDTATLAQATRDVRDFGVAVSEQDADQIERTNAAISRLGLIWRGMANTLTVMVAPALESSVNGLAEVWRSIMTMGDTAKAVFERMPFYIGAAAAAMAVKFVPAMYAGVLATGRLTAALLLTRAALMRTGFGLAIVLAGELAYRLSGVTEAADENSAAQARMNEALSLYNTVGSAARGEAVLATQAYIDETRAKIASAQATIQKMEAEQQAARQPAVESFNAMGDFPTTEPSDNGYSQAIIAAQEEAARLQDELQAALDKLNELETANPAGPINAATGAANGLTGALGGSLGVARQLVAALARAPGNIAALQKEAAGLNAEMMALASGQGDLAAASAKYRAGLEADYGLARLTHYEQRQMVQEKIDGEVAAFEAVERARERNTAFRDGLRETTAAAGAAGGALKQAGEDGKKGAEEALTGWDRVKETLADYVRSSMDTGAQVSDALVGAFRSAEDAIGTFVKTGKLEFGDLVSSIIADLARIASRRFILGPLANVLSGALSGLTGDIFHNGGVVGGPAPSRMVPAMAFAGAPRMHSGGWAGGLRPDEVPAILQKGERVLSRREAAGYGAGGVNITIQTRDAESFRQSRTQVASDIARAVRAGQRGM